MKALRTSENVPSRFVLPFRDGQRRPISWHVLLWIGANHHSCLITDLSLGGARIQLDVSLEPGTEVKIEIPDLCNFEGKVAWYKDANLGIQFTTRPERVRSSLGIIARALDLGDETEGAAS